MSNASQRKKLPANPSLEHLQKQAKRLVKLKPGLQLAAAQHQLAQENGCKNWAELARTVKAIARLQDPLAGQNRQVAMERYKEAQRLTNEGKPAEALIGLLWCFDKGKEDPGMNGVRRSAFVRALARLGASYPPAFQALCERRDQARKNSTAKAGNLSDWPDFVAINHYLGEDSVTLAFYDDAKSTGAHVPPSIFILPQLLEARRYAEAAAANPFDAYLRVFDAVVGTMTKVSQVPRKMHIDHLAKMSARAIEAFAGAGDLASARAGVEKTLQIDKSAETLATLREHASRAGHPELVPAD